MSLREPLARMAASVCVATSGPPGSVHGVTLTSVVGLAIEPPLVGFALSHGSGMLARLASDPRLGITVLSASQQDLAALCATAGRRALDEALLARGGAGSAHLRGGAAWFEGTVVQRLRVGDHEFLVARIDAHGACAAAPLLYHARGYARLASPPERMSA